MEYLPRKWTETYWNIIATLDKDFLKVEVWDLNGVFTKNNNNKAFSPLQVGVG